MPGFKGAAALGSGLATMTGVFWAGAWTMSAAAISWVAWSALYACCLAAAVVAWRLLASRRSRWWLAMAAYAVLAAAIFYGANRGLDALKGAHRKKPDVAASLGGIELWFVLVPGVFSIATGGWALACLRRGKAASGAVNPPVA